MANKELPAPELLRNAGRLIERALLQLNMREQECGECGTRHFSNTSHAKVYERLTDVPLKLQTLASTLEDVDGGFKPITEGR